jgi:hypothetical protein
MTTEWPQKRRPGLRYRMDASDLNRIGLAERVMALALSGYTGQWRRVYDSPGVTRVPIWSTVRIGEWGGPCVAVRGYVDGVEVRGLDCTACPVYELEPLGSAGR